MLNKYLHLFDDCFDRTELTERFEDYKVSWLLDLCRMSIEPMADAADISDICLIELNNRLPWNRNRALWPIA